MHKKCIPRVGAQLHQLKNVLAKLFIYLLAGQDSMKQKPNKGFNHTSKSNVEDQVWMITKNKSQPQEQAEK